MLFALFFSVALANDFADIVDEINGGNHGWTAEVPTRFGSLEDVKTVCGTWLRGHEKYVEQNFPETNYPTTGASSYDVRTAHPNCTVLGRVRDQSACGSCWAFGSTECFEGSKCIAGKGDIEYSADDTAGCCHSGSMGCNGGQPSSALGWMCSTGVVTGGEYLDTGKQRGCKPYEFKPCAHHVPPTAKYPACPSSEYSIRCTSKCEAASGLEYKSDKVKGSQAHQVRSVSQMEATLQKNGPLSVAFTVYADFPTYKSGVYTHKSGSALGGHAVAIYGFGTEGGVDYWLVKNSWNEQWGDQGFFKIKKGSDECGIEGDVTTVTF